MFVSTKRWFSLVLVYILKYHLFSRFCFFIYIFIRNWTLWNKILMFTGTFKFNLKTVEVKYWSFGITDRTWFLSLEILFANSLFYIRWCFEKAWREGSGHAFRDWSEVLPSAFKLCSLSFRILWYTRSSYYPTILLAGQTVYNNLMPLKLTAPIEVIAWTALLMRKISWLKISLFL